MFTSALMAIARVLAEPDLQLPELLNLFVRDEVVSWQQFSVARQPGQSAQDMPLRDRVVNNVELIMGRVRTLACLNPPEKVTTAPSRTVC